MSWKGTVARCSNKVLQTVKMKSFSLNQMQLKCLRAKVQVASEQSFSDKCECIRQGDNQCGQLGNRLYRNFQNHIYLLGTTTSYTYFASPRISAGCGPDTKYNWQIKIFLWKLHFTFRSSFRYFLIFYPLVETMLEQAEWRECLRHCL